MDAPVVLVLVFLCSGVARGVLSPPPSPPAGPPDPLLEAPEGYMAFVEAPNAEPPRVEPRPYVFVDVPCPGANPGSQSSRKTLNNLCGDLNRGVIPRNPMRPTTNGAPYPFELIKNKTLEFFSKALPILQADESLPKVAKSQAPAYYGSHGNNRLGGRMRSKRDAPEPASDSNPVAKNVADAKEEKRTYRTARKFCDNGGGVMCMLYKAIQGEPLTLTSKASPERREDASSGGSVFPDYRERHGTSPAGAGPHGGPHHGAHGGPGPHHGSKAPKGQHGMHGGYGPERESQAASPGPAPGPANMPPTPCSARVEYSTPVFARNYQGVWRYVVQIPYEGYFTQTVEVTRCLQNKCHYMEGACLSSPRWVSLLVAELFYPDAVLPAPNNNNINNNNINNNRDQQLQGHPQYLHKRSLRDLSGAGNSSESSGTGRSGSGNTHCDGVDEIGCFQVRLYYDWFLIPGSCKCWRPEYFSRFVRRKPAGSEL